MNARLLLDEHYAADIAERLVSIGHDVNAVVANPELRSSSDVDLFRWAASMQRRIVTENIKDFRPVLLDEHATGHPLARLLLVSPRLFPRGDGSRSNDIVEALAFWLSRPDVVNRPDENWLS